MISIIVAYANGRVIGKEGKIPWHLPDDLQYFKRITSGHTIVMGRKTCEAIGRPLPHRRNIVLTHNCYMHLPGFEVVHSTQEVLALGDVFIIGGESVYGQFLAIAERLYITEITREINGDAFFPAWDDRLFTRVSRQEAILDEQNMLPHTFYVYERKKHHSIDRS
ncbi:MAG: dihydrofolate reductase [Ktedonobacteraceae bacterium]